MAKKVMAEIISNSNNEPRNPNTIKYLICFKYPSGGTAWEIVTGRQDAFECIKDDYICTDGEINMEESFIMSDTATLSQAKSIIQFIQYCRDELREPWAQGFEMQHELNFDEDEFRAKRPVDPHMFDDQINMMRQIFTSNGYLSIRDDEHNEGE